MCVHSSTADSCSLTGCYGDAGDVGNWLTSLRLFLGFVLVLRPGPASISQVTLRLSLVCLFALTGQSGGVTVLQLYSSEVFGWSTEKASIGMTVMFASSAVGLAVVLPVLLRLGSAKTVVMISVGWATATWVFAGVATHGWQLTLALVRLTSTIPACACPGHTDNVLWGHAQLGALVNPPR